MTYRELREALDELSTDQLSQQIMLLGPHSGPDPCSLEPVVCAGTVEELLDADGEPEFEVRTSDTFHHVPTQVVLLYDHNPYSVDGDLYYSVGNDDKLVGNVSGKEPKL